MYKYETHLHTHPVSKCASEAATVENSLRYYKRIGYDGVFITNHFVDGNINIDRSLPPLEMLDFYFSDYEEGKRLEPIIGIKVLLGIEMSYGGTDFLIYGLPKEWYYRDAEFYTLKKSEQLTVLREAGAFIVQAHPFREARYIDHIRLYPRHIDAVEVINAENSDLENRLANQYARNYGLLRSAGSDNHGGDQVWRLAGVKFDTPLVSERDFVARMRAGEGKIFSRRMRKN